MASGVRKDVRTLKSDGSVVVDCVVGLCVWVGASKQSTQRQYVNCDHHRPQGTANPISKHTCQLVPAAVHSPEDGDVVPAATVVSQRAVDLLRVALASVQVVPHRQTQRHPALL